jgi:lipopolysaccharide export system protein LptA
MKATALIAFATAFLAAASLRTANAADDIDVKEGTGDVIGEIADVVSNFQLTDLPANLYIEADSMTFDYEGGKLTYQGDVEVKHGEVELRSDELVLTFQPGAEKSLQTINARGNVKVLRGEERAYGDLATYDPDGATITLEGNARLGSGENSIGGETVVVHLDRKRAQIKGGKPGSGGRVRAVIDPESVKLLQAKPENEE